MSELLKCQCCDLPVNQCRCLLELLKFVSNPEELLKNPQAVAEFVEMMQGTRPGRNGDYPLATPIG